MFGNSQKSQNIPSQHGQIGEHIRITGRVDSKEQLILGGSVEGDIHADKVVITATGSIQGNISADIVQVAGKVKGDITASHLMIGSTANVEGCLSYQTIEIETGADVAGEFKKTGRKDTEQPVLEQAVPEDTEEEREDG